MRHFPDVEGHDGLQLISELQSGKNKCVFFLSLFRGKILPEGDFKLNLRLFGRTWMMKRDYQCSRFTGIGCENHNENEQARKKKYHSLVQNSFWMELAVLEIAQEKPGRGPGGQKGQAWLLAGSVWMSMREIVR